MLKFPRSLCGGCGMWCYSASEKEMRNLQRVWGNLCFPDTSAVSFFSTCPQRCISLSTSCHIGSTRQAGENCIALNGGQQMPTLDTYCDVWKNLKTFMFWVQFSSVAQLRLILCDPRNCSSHASLSIINTQSPPKPMSIVSVMPSNHLILCHPLLLLPSIFPSIRVFSMSQLFASCG